MFAIYGLVAETVLAPGLPPVCFQVVISILSVLVSALAALGTLAAVVWAIYGERLTPAFLAGGCLVLGGVVLMQRPGTRTRSKTAGAPD